MSLSEASWDFERQFAALQVDTKQNPSKDRIGSFLKEASRHKLQLAQREELNRFLDEQEGLAAQVRARVARNMGLENTAREHLDRRENREEILATYEQQYSRSRQALISFGVDVTKAPPWESIKPGLTREVLNKVKVLLEPSLILVPPLTRVRLKTLINVVKVQNYRGKFISEYCDGNEAFKHNQDNNLFNGGLPENRLAWEVFIVEGVVNVPENTSIQLQNGHYLESRLQIHNLYHFFRRKGLDVIANMRRYLALRMVKLYQDQFIDDGDKLVLNANAFTHLDARLFGCADVSGAFANFAYFSSDKVYKNIRVRAACPIHYQAF